MYIDGLQCSNYDREVLEELRDGRMGAITITLGFWEDAKETLDAITRWRDLARDNSDLIEIATTTSDIERIAASGRTAIVLGTQNTDGLDGRIRYVELLHDLGLRVMQLTYNNQNAYGSSCYEEHDDGLSRAGHKLVREMNRVGVLIDLSHVGYQTTLDTIQASQAPVAITHANPLSLVDHKRNVPDHVITALAERGGVLGLAIPLNFTGEYAESVSKWCDMVEWTVGLAGIGHVGIGTDLGRKQTDRDLTWMRNGPWSKDFEYGAGKPGQEGLLPYGAWMHSTLQFPELDAHLIERGWSRDDADAFLGGNWLRLYRDTFDAH